MDPSATAKERLRAGQTLEALGTSDSLAQAIGCYDEALAALRQLPFESDPQLRRDLGVAWMNRGNALQKQASPASLAEAVAAYDEAIAHLQKLPLLENSAYANSLGAAWLNRGHAFQQQDGASLREAVLSHQTAIAILQKLPVAEDRSALINLAAAWMNLANALLALNAPKHADARVAAQASLALCARAESSDPVMADIALKARRALCDAIGHLLVAAGSDQAAVGTLATEASDAIDHGLALVRHWEFHGIQTHRALANRLYRFGAQLYLIHQPHFLAEFLLESLDPPAAPGALADDPRPQAFAAEFVLHALTTLRATSLVGLSLAEQARLHGAVIELEAAALKIAGLSESHLKSAL
ncbi:MAG: hypothetical protein KA257_01835 [Opitutaceae bacterium]|nr:hypothetical protein [Opitutaceae bacterium]MBP9911950.1 hypothetical protein [Opitutaceae bacterium]